MVHLTKKKKSRSGNCFCRKSCSRCGLVLHKIENQRYNFHADCYSNSKIERVKYFGDGYVQIKLVGQTYDESTKAAKEYSHATRTIYIPAFDDEFVISGQGTVGKEILMN